VCVCARART